MRHKSFQNYQTTLEELADRWAARAIRSQYYMLQRRATDRVFRTIRQAWNTIITERIYRRCVHANSRMWQHRQKKKKY